MILPYFDYGDIIYGSANKDGLDKLQRLQNKGLKLCMGYDRRHNTDDLHREAKCPKLESRRSAHVNNFMFNRIDRSDLVDNRPIRTRAHDAPLFRVDIPKNETFKRSVAYAGSTKWNALPTEMRNIKSTAVFKNTQKRVMMDTVT